jgi:tetratricopeptide (TPR) repeat protein
VIELMLQAERALAVGLIDQAERLYWQAVEADRRNAIAVVGLARVAIERGDNRLAYTFAQGALAIDPENDAARRLAQRLTEVIAYRGETLPPDPEGPLVSPFATPEEGGAAPASAGSEQAGIPLGPPVPETTPEPSGPRGRESGSPIRRLLGRRRS